MPFPLYAFSSDPDELGIKWDFTESPKLIDFDGPFSKMSPHQHALFICNVHQS